MKAKTLAKAAGAKHKVGTSNGQIKKPEEEGGRKRHMWGDKGFLRAPVYTRASRKLRVPSARCMFRKRPEKNFNCSPLADHQALQSRK